MTRGGQILKLFMDEGIAGSLPFEEVRRKAFAMLDAARLDAVAEYLIAEARFDEKAFEWQLLDKAAQRIKLSLRPIVQGLQLADATKKVSPVAWQHINFQGRYEFQKQPDPLDVDMIIRILTDISHNREVAQELD